MQTSTDAYAGVRQRLSRLAHGALPRPIPALVAWLGAAIALLAVLGAIAQFGSLPGFDLSAELVHSPNIPTLFSAGLLAFAAVLALRGRRELPGQARWIALAILFGFMAVDEAIMVHERLEQALSTDWQTLYAPIVAVAAVIWLAALRALWRTPPARVLWIAGAITWVGSQTLEALAWSGATLNPGGQYLNYAEEVLELVGTLLFVWALLIALAVPSGTTTAAERTDQRAESSASSRTSLTSST